MSETRATQGGSQQLTKAGNQELQQGGTAAAAPASSTDMLASTAGAVQGMMAAMGAPMPAQGGSALMQGAVMHPDGTTTTNIATSQPSEDARTSTRYDPATNTITTTTIDPASGSMATTTTTAPPGMAEAASREGQQAEQA